MEQKTHTPPPWVYVVIENKYHAGSHAEGNKTIVTVATVYSGGQAIARCHSVKNARFIVKAVNAHAKLIKLLTAALPYVQADEQRLGNIHIGLTADIATALKEATYSEDN